MGKTALLYLTQVKFKFLDHGRLLNAAQIRDLKVLAALNKSNLLLAQIDHPVRVFNDRCGIGPYQELVIAHTYYKGASLAGGYHAVRLRLVHDYNGISTYHAVESQRYSLLESYGVAVHDVLDKLDYHLRIGLTLKVIALILKFGLERAVVLNYTVVY